MYKIGTYPTLPGNNALYSASKIIKSAVIFDMLDYPTIKENNKFAITIDQFKCLYIDAKGKDASLVNHSCEPNLEVQIDQRLFVAKRTIEIGEMLTYDYLTTEPNMAEAFNCVCGSLNCKRIIKGYN